MRLSRILILTSLSTLSAGAGILACSGSSSTPPGGGDGGSSTQHASSTSKSSSKSSSTQASSQGTSSASSQSAVGDAGLPDAVVAACGSAGAATCALQAKCDPQAQVTDYGDGGTCLSRATLNCIEGFAAPGNGNTAAHTLGCVSAESTETCANDLDLDPPTACLKTTGSGAAGAMCNHPAQCQSGFCAIAPQSECGVCAAPPAVGSSCAELTTCGQALECYKGVCVAYTATVGGPCSDTQPCGAGLDCVTPADAGSGTCQTSGATVGATCDPTLKTGPGCDNQLLLYCVSDSKNPNVKTCQTETPVAAGSACGRVDGGADDLCGQGTCVKGDGGSTCVGRAEDNGACNTVTGPDCLAPARCIGAVFGDGGTAGKCTLPGPTCGSAP